MFNIPIISDFFGFKNIYPMKIYEKGDELNPLPCDILSNDENQSWEIPTEPIETSEFIGDTQFRQPKQISLNVFVKTEAVSEFERRIKQIQGNKNGFVFVDRDGFSYSDFWLTTYQKTGEMNNGYIFALSLQELILIEAFSNAVTYQKTSNAGLSGKTNNGEQSSNAKKGGATNSDETPQSTLYGLIY